jgi:hypothetical protein
MTLSIPSEQDISSEISIMQVREMLALLNAPLAPGECLRRAATLSGQQQETRGLLQQLDTADVGPTMRGNLADYRRYVKGSILGTLRGVNNLSVRHDYLIALKENVALHIGELERGSTDVAAALFAADNAVINRNLTRKMFAAHGARTYAQIQSQGLSAWWNGAKRLVLGRVEDKRTFEALARTAAKGADISKFTPEQKVDVLLTMVENSGKPGKLSTAWKTLSGTAATVQMTIDLLLIIEETRQARDPLRVITANAVRMGTAVAVTTATEGVVVAVVSALAIGSGVGLVVVGVGMVANHFVNEWVNTTVMDYYDHINPRIADVMRDLSWEPESFRTSLQEPLGALSMTADIKSSMVAAL